MLFSLKNSFLPRFSAEEEKFSKCRKLEVVVAVVVVSAAVVVAAAVRTVARVDPICRPGQGIQFLPPTV